VDAILVDPVSCLPVAGDLRQVDEVLSLTANLLPERRVVIRRQTGENFDKIEWKSENVHLAFYPKHFSSGLLRGLWIHHRMNQALESFILWLGEVNNQTGESDKGLLGLSL
jgi:hypothetical protein